MRPQRLSPSLQNRGVRRPSRLQRSVLRGAPLRSLRMPAGVRSLRQRVTTHRDKFPPHPPPWTAYRIEGGYVVSDANGQALAYVYSRANEAEALQANVLTEDEARRVAANIAKLPTLLQR